MCFVLSVLQKNPTFLIFMDSSGPTLSYKPGSKNVQGLKYMQVYAGEMIALVAQE
jgi:hypothetical protein